MLIKNHSYQIKHLEHQEVDTYFVVTVKERLEDTVNKMQKKRSLLLDIYS